MATLCKTYRYRVVKVEGVVKTVITTNPISSYEYTLQLSEMLEQRNEIDIRIAAKLGDITQEEADDMLENTYYRVEKY